MDKELLFFEPVFKTMVWGGNRMEEVFGYNIPADNTGECWAVSAHPNGDCVCKSGTYAGHTLSWLWDNKRELFGNYKSKVFPLLLKVIDARTDLSIQVHPDGRFALNNEDGAIGKTECWYILDCQPDSTLVVGHNATTREELYNMIDNREFESLIREVPVKKGDFLQIEPGTIHAIKGGMMILETQGNSDITYRLYDYDRLSDGKYRALHIAQAKAVMLVPDNTRNVVSSDGTKPVEELISCETYAVARINVEDSLSLDDDVSFRILSCIEGSGRVDGIAIEKGEHFIVPNGYGEINFTGKMTLISSVPG